MPTAIVHALDHEQRPIECRTLVDTCSDANYVTEEFASKLHLRCKGTSVAIEALNALSTVTNKLVSTTIKSRLSDFQRHLSFFVIPRISRPLPGTQIDRTRFKIPANLKLADPNFHRPASVDMLIGTGPSLASFSVGQISLSPRNGPDLILQKTQLGWIIGGSVLTTSSRIQCKTFATSVNFDLSKFWDIEEGPQQRYLSSEERDCEDHFTAHVQRDKTGRYLVALPFNQKKQSIGDSRSRAYNRFLSLERKLHRDKSLQREYSSVIQEYISLGHMSMVKTRDSDGFYLPHHAVIKPSSMTTKVRVVFDGSAKSSSGLSLNDALMIGPIQDNIFSLLLRFRMYVYVLTGDIEKMYRQILIQPEDRRYQRILWRDERNEIATFELNTVTFGLSSAPYLAIRCIHQLADDEEESFPRAASILKRDMYVDDLLTGADTYAEAKGLRDEVIALLQRGGLNIRQWVSNEPGLLDGLSEDQIHPKFFGDSTVKTLGVSWDARNDTVTYTVDPDVATKVTKRTILSIIARIFDPLGLLAPVTIVAKILMQRLWHLKLDWDESLPTSLHTEWITFANDFKHLHNISFGRNVTQRASQRIELHGFCDASERAYGACLYIRTIDKCGKISANLLCAKSRVAPLKTISLARLELCGAVLLASLYATVREAIKREIDSAIFWTDSTIVLNWLHKEPCFLKTFVANRVSEIQTKTDITAWCHVRSCDNPADLLSRGQPPAQFLRDSNWRHGPQWLSSIKSAWPESRFEIVEEVPDIKSLTCFVTTTINSDEILTRYSSLSHLRRIIAYCLRFRLPHQFKGPLTVEELHVANDRVVQLVQSSAFTQDLHHLKTGAGLHPKSKLLPLHPFVDDKGILRVGGRLQNSTLPYEQKHPILLPKGHRITELVIREAHLQHHHAGINSTLYAVRQTYWPIDGKNTTRKIVRQCVRCFRVNPPVTDYVMGNLPAARVTETRPFYNCGVDYCGPFYIKERRFRNRTRIKVYVAVFICLATKAVHLETVSDMTTEAFIAALKRLIARRGLCRNMYSDNGSNFIGANNELREIHEELLKDGRVQHFLADKGISWHFMPALSPHFGGLWEAAVKSFKHHVKRVVGEELFTFEQFNTFVIEVEAILNSRPLTPLSCDSNDPIALTPGHFLIGNSLTSLPETDFKATATNRLSNWQHIQKVKQDFWSRWHKEYINHLNVRHKWTKGSHTIKEGTIVVMRDDQLPPLQWHLGRIEKVHPGKDDIVRTVTVRTFRGVYSRNVKQLAPLPVHNEAGQLVVANKDI